MRHAHYATGDARRPCFSIDLDFTVNMLVLCVLSNLLLVLSAKERRTFLKLLWGLVVFHALYKLLYVCTGWAKKVGHYVWLSIFKTSEPICVIFGTLQQCFVLTSVNFILNKFITPVAPPSDKINNSVFYLQNQARLLHSNAHVFTQTNLHVFWPNWISW